MTNKPVFRGCSARVGARCVTASRQTRSPPVCSPGRVLPMTRPSISRTAPDPLGLHFLSERASVTEQQPSGIRTMDEQGQGELVLTYAELATKLGVSPDGARTRAKRAGWPVTPGNDGRSRVRVRAAELPQLPRSHGEQIPEQNGSVNALLAELRRAYGEHS